MSQSVDGDELQQRSQLKRVMLFCYLLIGTRTVLLKGCSFIWWCWFL